MAILLGTQRSTIPPAPTGTHSGECPYLQDFDKMFPVAVGRLQQVWAADFLISIPLLSTTLLSCTGCGVSAFIHIVKFQFLIRFIIIIFNCVGEVHMHVECWCHWKSEVLGPLELTWVLDTEFGSSELRVLFTSKPHLDTLRLNFLGHRL